METHPKFGDAANLRVLINYSNWEGSKPKAHSRSQSASIATAPPPPTIYSHPPSQTPHFPSLPNAPFHLLTPQISTTHRPFPSPQCRCRRFSPSSSSSSSGHPSPPTPPPLPHLERRRPTRPLRWLPTPPLRWRPTPLLRRRPTPPLRRQPPHYPHLHFPPLRLHHPPATLLPPPLPLPLPLLLPLPLPLPRKKTSAETTNSPPRLRRLWGVSLRRRQRMRTFLRRRRRREGEWGPGRRRGSPSEWWRRGLLLGWLRWSTRRGRTTLGDREVCKWSSIILKIELKNPWGVQVTLLG